MHLSVKNRIAVSMAMLVMVSAVGAAITASLHAKAGRFGEAAREQAQIARSTQHAAQAVAQFVADGTALALAVSASGVSEDVSFAYGQVQGSEQEASHALRALEQISEASSGAPVVAEWEGLRLLTYFWVNSEAADAGSPLRITLDGAGAFRASVVSNLRTPPGSEAMSTSELRRSVRDQGRVMTDASLRRLVREAERSAGAALADETTARRAAQNGTFLFIGVSLVLALFVATWLYGTIARPLEKARAFAKQVAAGDLAAVHGTHSADEIGTLTRAMESMRDAVVARVNNLHELAGVVLVTAEGVSEAATRAKKAADHIAMDEEGPVIERIEDMAQHAAVLENLASQMLSG